MDTVSNFYSVISGIDVAVSVFMFLYYLHGHRSWSRLCRIGWLTMAAGLLGQSLYIIDGITLTDDFVYQFWALKDIGIAIFTTGLIANWIYPRR